VRLRRKSRSALLGKLEWRLGRGERAAYPEKEEGARGRSGGSAVIALHSYYPGRYPDAASKNKKAQEGTAHRAEFLTFPGSGQLPIPGDPNATGCLHRARFLSCRNLVLLLPLTGRNQKHFAAKLQK
jgi:hypothetical protein